MPNRLASETSPYLLQHKDNPVDWHPWGEEALARSRDEVKPIFLSIGYSACHWCHVMEHESFEHPAIAKVLNDNFVCIKVDREERPDIDQIYMNAVQIMTGHGGWPMSMFLLPDLRPFYGGTYWPPTAARGMPGFDQVLAAVLDAYNNRRDQCEAGADQITEQLRSVSNDTSAEEEGSKIVPSERLLVAAGHALEQSADRTFGGFGDAPKFPAPMALRHLLRLWYRTGQDDWLAMVRITLDRMADGGIYDHLGGGFARYSVDERWLVPHFEKMLYDNAQLAWAYTEAWQATGETKYRRVACETLDYLLRDMADPSGGFYCAEDADSEGEEGLFYTWTPSEIEALLGSERAELLCRVYGVTDEGNFEGRSILHLAKTIAQYAKIWQREEDKLSQTLAECRTVLLAAREKRVRPGRDDKVLLSWNAFAIEALARAGVAFNEPRYIAAAEKAARFVLGKMRDDNGRLLHGWKDGKAKFAAYLDDYTALACALLSLYEATFDPALVDEAAALMETVGKHFAADSQTGYFYTADDHEELITRTRELTDSATPSGNALAATALVRLANLTGRADFADAAAGILQASAALMQRVPQGMGQMLLAADLHIGPCEQWVIVGNESTNIASELLQKFEPHRLFAAGGVSNSTGALASLFEGRKSQNDQPTLYRCVGQTCQAPLAGREAICKSATE